MPGVEKAVLILDPAQHSWLRDAGLRAIFAALKAAGAEARVVGGAVRNSMLGVPVSDLDLAANVPPERAEAALAQAGIKSVRTGFDHGTITAVVAHRGYEITSLRRDIATNGRHAEVAYTDVWQDDAARRDFTMNALYVDSDSRVYDYHHGLDDLRAGVVRFIGDAGERIAEDYLRILRFFRFHAAYGRGAMDAAGLTACTVAAPLLGLLSRERVTQEFKKILLVRDPVPVLEIMRTHDIVPQIVPVDLRIERFAALLQLDRAVEFPVRLASLLPTDVLLEPVLRSALRLSAVELRDVMALCDPDKSVPPQDLPRALYHRGAEYCRARLLVQAAAGMKLDLAAGLAQIAAWRQPAFPLTGDDLQALGIAPSPRMGEILRAVEEWWLVGGFVADKTACRTAAQQMIGDRQ